MKFIPDMSFQNTKATPHHFIKRSLKLKDHALSTDFLLRELKSTSNPRGLRCEYYVALKYINNGFELVAHNFKVSGVQVDLLVFKQGFYYLVEVKSCRQFTDIHYLISKKQRERLLWALEMCMGLVPSHQWQFDVCFVNFEQKILRMQNFLSNN